MWLCEPDASQHARGLGSAEARDSIQGNDARLGRILAAINASDVPTTLIIASDHGHSTVTGMVRTEHALTDAGFGAALKAGYIHLADSMMRIEDGPGAATLRDDVGAWLREQPWVGAFVDWSRGEAADGILSPALLWNRRERRIPPLRTDVLILVCLDRGTERARRYRAAPHWLYRRAGRFRATAGADCRPQSSDLDAWHAQSTRSADGPDRRRHRCACRYARYPGGRHRYCPDHSRPPRSPATRAGARSRAQGGIRRRPNARIGCRAVGRPAIAVPSGSVQRHWVGKTAYLETTTTH